MTAITPQQLAGMNVDQYGVPFLNISRYDLLSLNYDQYGQPFLGIQLTTSSSANMMVFFQ